MESPKKVDIHCHLYPPAYLEKLQELDRSYTITPDSEGRPALWREGSRLVTFNSKMTSIEEHIVDMNRLGVDVQVLSVSIPNVYLANPDDALKLAEMANDYYVQISERYSGRIMGFASVPLPHVEHAISELNRALGSERLNGVILGDNINGRPLDSPEFRPFFKRANELDATIFLHPMTPPAVERLNEYSLAPLVGFIFDTTIAVERLVFSGMLDMFPRIKFILPHVGGAAPYLTGRWTIGWEAYEECRRFAPQPPISYLRRMYYDVVSLHQPTIRCAYDTVGPGKLLLGSDYPHVIGDVSRTIGSINHMDISSADKEAILGANALGILNNVKAYA